MAQYQLPNDFFFGAAMSGPQTEGQWNQGGKLEDLWDTWSIQDLGSFYNCVGSYAGNDFMAKYQEDLRIMKDLGLDTYRTSIQWSRLLDADGNIPSEPVITDASSVRISPKRFSVTSTSKLLGHWIMRMAALSTNR